MRARSLLEFVGELKKGEKVVKCLYCGYRVEFKLLKIRKFRFYDVRRLQCLRYNGMFNYNYGVSPRTNRVPEFVIRR
jgi:DNA-directed RNA polymerase subunit RPC12/RpoP